MIVVDKLLVGGIGWVLRRVADAATAELFDEGALREELLAAQMQLELGEIDETAFAVIESRVLARIRQVQAFERGERSSEAPAGRYAVEAIDADVGDSEP